MTDAGKKNFQWLVGFVLVAIAFIVLTVILVKLGSAGPEWFNQWS